MTETNLPATTQPQRTAITAGGNVGALIPQDIEQAFRIAQALAHSGMTPNGFKTAETCFVAIMAGAELGLPPFQSLQSFAIINNRPTLWGDALMAVVRTNGFRVREWAEGEGDDYTAYCEITRPDNGDVAQASFSVQDAKTAGLWKKAGPWTTNPKRMQKMRARAFAIRDGAADVLRGFQIREEVEDYDATPLHQDKQAGTGLLAKLQTTETLATEGFGIRDIDKEAGEPAPAAEPKKRGRPKKEQTALEAIAEAEPEIVAQVVEDHGSPDDDIHMIDGYGPMTTEQVQELEKGFDGVEEAPEPPADAQVEDAAPVEPEPPAEASSDLFQAKATGRAMSAFDAFFYAADDARGWDDLRSEMLALTQTEEWKAKPHDQKKARARVWELVQRWNEDGAKLDPAADAFLFQALVSTSTDVEVITGTLEVVKGQKWYLDAPEDRQASVRRFVAGRIEEIGRGA